jgi:hypothetical protein
MLNLYILNNSPPTLKGIPYKYLSVIKLDVAFHIKCNNSNNNNNMH